MVRPLPFATATTIAIVLGSGCASKGEETFTDSGTTQDDAGIPVLVGDAADAGCFTCGQDPHTIVTCGDLTPVSVCADDKGCAGGTCIDACDAAAMGKSTVGCDYYTIAPDAWGIGSCFAAFVTNTWSVPMKVSLTWKGQVIDAIKHAYVPKGTGSSITYEPVPSSGIPPNTMAIVFLNDSKMNTTFYIGCPAGTDPALSNVQMVVPGTRIADAMEIKTSVPAVVYDIYPYGGAQSYIASATLLIPSTAWDTNYVTATVSEEPGFLKSGVDFIARENSTNITVLPSTDILAGPGVAAATKGVPITYTLNKGQAVHIAQPNGYANTLAGSIVQSDKPIGVWGEANCMDHQHPAPRWRIVGAVNGTNLTYDPPIATAPPTLARGQLVEFDGPEAFHVQAQDDQHPFYLAAHRPGTDCDSAHQEIPSVRALGYEYAAIGNETTRFDLGGPETVNVIPPAQFLSEYIFFADPTYGNTDLAIVRAKTNGTFKDVVLDCLGNVSGWKPLGSKPYEYAHVDLRHNGAPNGKCDNGLHTMKSDAPFGLTVWGYDLDSSYAYPAGASVKPINTVVIPPSPN